jgi:hypothetical protein
MSWLMIVLVSSPETRPSTFDTASAPFPEEADDVAHDLEDLAGRQLADDLSGGLVDDRHDETVGHGMHLQLHLGGTIDLVVQKLRRRRRRVLERSEGSAENVRGRRSRRLGGRLG